MSTFSVHVREYGRGERLAVVREGFSLIAFLFGPLAYVLRRMWLALVLWIGAAGLGVLAATTLQGGPAVGWGVTLLLIYLLAMEDGNLRRSALRRRGFVFVDLVEAQNAGESKLAYAYRQASESSQTVASGLEARRRDLAPDDVGLLFGGR